MSLTLLPTPPSTSDPANFEARADAFLAALAVLVTELNTIIGLTIPDGSAAANTLTGNTLAANVLNSSLTALGTIANLVATNAAIASLAPAVLTLAQSGENNQTLASGANATMFSSAGSGSSYLVVARVKAPTANYHAAAIVDHTDSGAAAMSLTSIGPLAISVSGTSDVQVTQSGGAGSLNIEYNWTKLS